MKLSLFYFTMGLFVGFMYLYTCDEMNYNIIKKGRKKCCANL